MIFIIIITRFKAINDMYTAEAFRRRLFPGGSLSQEALSLLSKSLG